MGLAVYTSASTSSSFWSMGGSSQSDAQGKAMSQCSQKYPSGCKPGGATNQCMALAWGTGDAFQVAVASTLPAAKSAATAKVGNPSATTSGHCASE